jgi:arylsulfatase A-like enzyme
MSDARADDRGKDPRQFDRRTLIRDGLRAGGAITGASAAIDALSASTSQAASRALVRNRHRAQPNILVIVVDQLRLPRWFGAGVGGTPELPPNIARLRAGGVSFERHYTASNDCTPSRSALLTGLYTHQTGCLITGASTLQPEFATWGTMLREHGYSTYWYGKWHLTSADRYWTERTGPRALDRYGFAGGTFPSPNGAPGQGWREDGHIAHQFDEWYRRRATDAPWCTTVSLINPHDIAWWYRLSERTPYEISAPHAVRDLPPNFETPAQLEARNTPLVQRSLQQTTDLSFGRVPYSGSKLLPSWLPFLDLYVKLQMTVDTHVGHVLDTLASRPDVAANTIVVFTSDHGEYGGSHGLRGKGAGLYEEGINVPLIVNDPRGDLTTAPEVPRTQITSSVDVAPLLLTLASGSGAWRDEPRYEQVAGRLDIAAILSDPNANGREHALHATDEVVTEFALQPYDAVAPLHITGLISQTSKYGMYAHWHGDSFEPREDGLQTELYDLTTASGRLETDNLAGRSSAESAVRATLEQAAREEIQAALPARLHEAQRRGRRDYFSIARGAALGAAQRRHQLQNIVGNDLGGQLPGGKPGRRRRHRVSPR